MKIWKHLFVACCLLGCCAMFGANCGPSTSPPDGTNPDSGNPETTGPTLEPKLSVIQAEVFNRSCSLSSCHGAGVGGLTLKEGESHKNLVGVDSLGGGAGVKRVVAGDPDNSLLFRILTEAKVGNVNRMPSGGESISQAKIDLIREWIKRGALDD